MGSMKDRIVAPTRRGPCTTALERTVDITSRRSTEYKVSISMKGDIQLLVIEALSLHRIPNLELLGTFDPSRTTGVGK